MIRKSKLPTPQSLAPVETIGVLIPTYRRSKDLLRCLDAFHLQTTPADDILLIVREDDADTRLAVSTYNARALPLRILLTNVPGTVSAHNIGIEAALTDVLAMIDDDTVPHPDFLERILAAFQADVQLGGLGGRDRCFDGTTFDDRQRSVVGKLQWFGRAIGNHHLGHGVLREVDILKGASMSYRREALQSARCDQRLRGQGAQPNEDVSLSLAVKHLGWKNAYDPRILVDHFQGSRDDPRFYGGVLRVTNPQAFRDFAFNELIAVWPYLTIPRKVVFLAWSALVGTGVCPGFVQGVRFTRKLGFQSWYRCWLAQQGKFSAIFFLLRSSLHNGV